MGSSVPKVLCQSATKRSSLPIPTDSPFIPRTHFDSHCVSCGHTLPHTAGREEAASIQNLLNVTGSTILNNFTAVYGAAAVAAMGIGQKLHSIPMQMVFGFTQGIMPLVSYNYASGNRERMKKTITFGLGLVIPVMTAVTVCFWIFSPQLIRLFMDNEEIMLYGPQLLRGLCLSLLLLSIDFTAISVFQALGRGRYALIFAVMRKLLLEIPLLYILNAVLPLYGLAYAQCITEVILAAAAVVMLIRIFRQDQK